jgi:hypothetical protein
MSDFGRLLEKEIPRLRLRRYAHELTRSVSRADDLVQDTLVRAIAKQSSWQCGTCKRRPTRRARRHRRDYVGLLPMRVNAAELGWQQASARPRIFSRRDVARLPCPWGGATLHHVLSRRRPHFCSGSLFQCAGIL